MIELSPKEIKEFQRIAREAYGKELTYEEAQERGTQFARFAARICASKCKRENRM